MNNYSITFKSLRAGTVYTLNIGGGTGAAIPLKGGAHPFTTQEDDSDDMFTPIRTQTGYIRIVDDGKDANGNALTTDWWKDLIPQTGTSRPVSLTAGGNTLWQGFMQPQSFSGVLYGNPQEREFPVMCQLSALDGFDIEPGIGGVKDFGWLLYYIFGRAGTWRYFTFQGADAVGDWLQKGVSWMNFVAADSNNIGRSKYSCLQILEDICTFWGWTCRVHGQDVWFTAADDSDINHTWRRVQYNDLSDIASAQPTQVSYGSFAVEDFVDTDNQDMYALGYHKITINANINKFENVLEIPFSQISPMFDGKSVSHTSQGDTHTFIVNYYPTSYENNILDIDCYWDQSYIGGRFTAFEVYKGDIADKHNYNFTYALAVFGANEPFDEHCMKLSSKWPISFVNGVVTINGEARMTGDGNDGSGDGYLVAGLKIGSKWWNGSSWSTTRSTFHIPVKANKIADNRVLTGPYVEYTGLGLPVQNMGGIVEFYILGSHSNGTSEGEQALITSLEFGFARLASAAENNGLTENVYTQTNNSKFSDELTLDMIFATDNGNASGYGIIMNTSGAYAQTARYTGQSTVVQERPEQHLADRMALYYSAPINIESVNLDTNEIGDVSPGDKSGSYYPVAIGHDWRDDVTRLKLMKV